ncbi:MAG: YbaK/EbsC family protein [Anaerolineales bacterium]|nr:YbaK/EbsC family protein [Anaerolineales bacterium]
MPLSASAQKVQAALAARGFSFNVLELEQSTRTSQEAAAAAGCELGQIVKSIIFRSKESDRVVLVLTSGSNRVNEKAVAALLGEALGKADAEFVRARTGFVIGGVAPVGHLESPVTFIDEDLLQYVEVWAAAGTPNAIFKLSPQDLPALTGGQVAAVKV